MFEKLNKTVDDLWTFKFPNSKSKKYERLKNLKKEVSVNANGTREYVIKKGINKGKIAKWKKNITQCLLVY